MFNWLKPKPKKEYKVPELEVLKFGKLIYSPQEDITPHEVALLLPLFLSMFYYNRQKYIEKNNLSRHFIEEKEDASTSK